MSLVCRFDRRYGDSTNIWKLKALFVCTIRQSFRRELASAKEHFLETSALGNLSDLMKAYYDEKIGSAKSLSSMIEIHGLRQNVVIADISAKVFFDEGLTMEPLGLTLTEANRNPSTRTLLASVLETLRCRRTLLSNYVVYNDSILIMNTHHSTK